MEELKNHRNPWLMSFIGVDIWYKLLIHSLSSQEVVFASQGDYSSERGKGFSLPLNTGSSRWKSLTEKGREQPAGMLCRKQSWKQAWLGEEKEWERAELRGSWLLQSKQSRSPEAIYRGMVVGPFSCKGLGKDGVRSSKEAEAGSSQIGYGHSKTSAEPAQFTLTCTCQICPLSGVELLLGRSHTYLSRQRPQPTSQPQSTTPGRAHLTAPISLLCFVGAGKPGSDVTFWFECLPSLRALMGSHPTNSTLLMDLGKIECLHGLHVHTQSSWFQCLRFPRPDKYATYYLIYKLIA